MGIGRDIDRLAGQLSRVLHGFRSPRLDTVPDLDPYLDLDPGDLLPLPPRLDDVQVERTVFDRAVHASTLRWPSGHRCLSPAYERRHLAEYRANLNAFARWIRPEGGALRPTCLVYVHGWLEPGSWVEESLLFPSWVRRLGVDVVHVSLPFHGRRNPADALFSGEYFWTADLVRSFEGVRQAIFDVRRIIGWLRRQGYQRVGAAGPSLGGAIVMLLACLESPPDFIVPIVAHTQLGEAVERATILHRMKQDLERFGHRSTERARIFERLGLASYLPLLSPDRQLWIEAEDDAHIDPTLVRRQWEAWGRPRLHWIPGGHMTFPAHIGEITQAMAEFLMVLDAPSGAKR